MPKIVLSGGGTGGHLKPVLSCARALKQLDKSLEPVIFTDRPSLSSKLIRQTKWPVYAVAAGKWRRYTGQKLWQKLLDIKTILLNLLDLFKLAAGFWQALWRLIRIKPSVVFVKGGYVGLPVGLAAWALGIPLAIHESDATPGLTNRILAHLSAVIMTGWPAEYYPNWNHKKPLFTGNIVDTSLLKASRQKARKHFGLEAKLPVLLVIGGSSGSKAINRLVVSNLNQLTKHFQVIHVSGKANYQKVKKATAGNKSNRYHLYDFLTADLGLAYAAADVVVSRAGANTLAELTMLKKPSIIIPHQYSPSAHQSANADAMAEIGAVVVLPEDQMNKRFVQAVMQLRDGLDRRASLAKAMALLAKPDATKEVARKITELI